MGMGTVMVIFQYDNVEGVTILLPADDQDISIQVQGLLHCVTTIMFKCSGGKVEW